MTELDEVPVRLRGGVTVDGECWRWRTVGSNGYPNGVWWHGQRPRAHRLFYTLMVGPIPDGLELDHLCRQRLCVRPDHLEPVTRSENLARSPLVGRWGLAKTHCVNGHEFSPENTFTDPRGHRGCRACRLAALRRWRARKKRAA